MNKKKLLLPQKALKKIKVTKTPLTIQEPIIPIVDIFSAPPEVALALVKAVEAKVIKPRKKSKASEREHYVNNKEFEMQIKEYYTTDIICDVLANSINKIAHGLSFAPNFINYCADETTEALTQRGWLRHDQINCSDTILSYDITTKQLVWSRILDIYCDRYEGKMHQLKMKGFDALVTPGHKFVSDIDGLKPVELLKCTENIVTMGSPVKCGSGAYSDDFVELMGWAVTEGNYMLGKKTHAVQIFQNKGLKADRIRNCLKRQGIKFKEYDWSNPKVSGFRFNKEFANKVIEIAPGRVLSTDFILSLTQKQRLLLIQTMVDGDGNTIPTGLRGYVQKCKDHMDRFIMLCTLAGLTTTTRFIKHTSSFGYSEYFSANVYKSPKLLAKVENINFNGGRSKAGGINGKQNNPNVPTIDYSGIIWCPTTEYGTFICRRNGKVYVTGNSYKDEMVGDAIVKMFSALKHKKFKIDCGFSPFSYFTTIAFHAFINRIKQEKKHHDTINEYKEKIYMETMQDESITGGKVYVEPNHNETGNFDEQ